MTPFVDLFPDLAPRETRVAFLPQPSGGLPAGRYAFITKSVTLTPEGEERARELFHALFDR